MQTYGTSVSVTVKHLNKILILMINCLFKLIMASRGFACDSADFLSRIPGP